MSYPEEAKYEERNTKLPLVVQEKTISELSELVSMLVDRLTPVLRPKDETTKAGEENTTRPVQSPLAEELDQNNARIKRVSNQLSSVLERLDC